MTSYADCEPVLKPSELARYKETVHIMVSDLPDDAQLSAVRTPNGEVHFIVASLHPLKLQRSAGSILADVARITEETWDEYARVKDRYVYTGEDKALKIFRLLASRHAEKHEQLRNTIN